MSYQAAIQAEPTLGDIFADLWRGRFWLLGGLLLGGLAVWLFLALAIPQYRTAMIVAPMTRSGTPDIAALFPKNASFAMEYVLQSFGPGDSSDFMRFEAIIREPSVASRLFDDPQIRRGIISSGRYRFLPADEPRDSLELSAWLKDNVVIEPVPNTKLKRLVVLHPDPVFGAYLLNRLYLEADSLIRSEIHEKTQARVAWLKQTLGHTENPEHRRILTDLLMDQEQIRMILSVNEPYAASVAEPAAAGPKPYWPRKPLYIPLFLFVGMFAGYALFSMRRRA